MLGLVDVRDGESVTPSATQKGAEDDGLTKDGEERQRKRRIALRVTCVVLIVLVILLLLLLRGCDAGEDPGLHGSPVAGLGQLDGDSSGVAPGGEDGQESEGSQGAKGLFAIIYDLFSKDDGSSSSDLVRDPASEPGQLDGKTPEEVQAELNRVVEEGMFQVSVNTGVSFASADAKGEVRIENSPANRYDMRAVIARDDTGQQVYATGLIQPGWHIQEDCLDVALDEGIYPCTAMVYAHDVGTGEQVGAVAVKVTLEVLG